eukprot:GHUV01023595.1.p1 GENE.GHUV01023595.1~~GHUV01023595.1.p1  ORF type:complete len:290 (+),score=85.03 GHUV01023595.1:210-1079(+)
MQARQRASSAPAPATPAAWSFYFPDSAYVAQDRRALLITELLGALQSEEGWNIVKNLQSVQQEYVLQLDYQQLLQICDSPDLAAALEMQPLEGLACLQAAVHEAVFHVHKQRTAILPAAAEGPAKLAVQLTNYTPSEMHIRQLKSSSIGKLSTLRGTVTRMSHVRPLIVDMTFTCNKCGNSVEASMPDGRFTPPTRCTAEGCKGRSFTPERSTARCIDWQKLRLQELLGADQQAQGKVPRSVEVRTRQGPSVGAFFGGNRALWGLLLIHAMLDDQQQAQDWTPLLRQSA